jgi:DNA-binding NtrC family response regulator
MGAIPVVAIFNTSDDVVEMLRYAIEAAGFVVVSGHVDAMRRADASLQDVLEGHDPRVILYDIAPPYDRSWRFFEHMRSHPWMKGRQFVLTSTNAKRVSEIVGTEEPVYEIIGKPYDIDTIVEAVKKAASSVRSSREDPPVSG